MAAASPQGILEEKLTRIFRYPPVREPIRVYSEEDQDFFEPGGERDMVRVEAWGTDHRPHEVQIYLKPGLMQDDPRNPDTVYTMLEQHLEISMRRKGVWE